MASFSSSPGPNPAFVVGLASDSDQLRWRHDLHRTPSLRTCGREARHAPAKRVHPGATPGRCSGSFDGSGGGLLPRQTGFDSLASLYDQDNLPDGLGSQSPKLATRVRFPRRLRHRARTRLESPKLDGVVRLHPVVPTPAKTPGPAPGSVRVI